MSFLSAKEPAAKPLAKPAAGKPVAARLLHSLQEEAQRTLNPKP